MKTLQMNTTHQFQKREVEVLHLLAKGADLNTVSKELFISYFTVQFHVKKLKIKLEANNLTGLVTKAMRLGIVSMND
jgi:DNA-binding NarL/FixJ family response regulator